jgi:predicted patatin/cPLA2 family phospholipase
MTGINYIPADEEKDLTLTWFYDEIPEEYRQVRKFVQVLEQEYLELRQLLEETEEKLQIQSTKAELQARTKYLKKRIAGLEKKFPWPVSEQFLEYALWGVPH